MGATPPPCPCCSALPPPPELPANEAVYSAPGIWKTDEGREVSLKTLAGRPQVVAFFFTSCHVTCPVTVQNLAGVAAKAGASKRFGFVLVTMDPYTDTAAVLASFRKDHRMGSDWTLLRGESDATQALAKKLGITYRIDHSVLRHSPGIVVLDRGGKVAGSFTGLYPDIAAIAALANRL